MFGPIILNLDYDDAILIVGALSVRADATGIKNYADLHDKVLNQIADCRMNNAAEKAARIARGEVA